MNSIKMCDVDVSVAAKALKELNKRKVLLVKERPFDDRITVILAKVHPKKLIYPEGWYYAKGMFRNKHNSSTGLYQEIPMEKPRGGIWPDD